LLLTLLFIAQFCYIFNQVVAESVVTVVSPAGRCHAVCTHLPPPSAALEVLVLRSKAVCGVYHIRLREPEHHAQTLQDVSYRTQRTSGLNRNKPVTAGERGV